MNVNTNGFGITGRFAMPPKSRASRPPKQCQTIPLICTLCPKNPNFSDTSHLLTHISSKSHLAARFKLQIRSQSEQEARDILDNFDTWYRDNNLDALLSDRLAIKEQKKAAKDRKNNENRGVIPVKREPIKRKEPAKQEEDPADEFSVLQRTPVYRAPVPRMALWHTNRNDAKSGTATKEDWQSGSIFETPTAASKTMCDGNIEGGTVCEDMLDPRLVTPHKAPVEEDDEGKSTDSATKLKGIFWPGMDLFDSATPGMKKRRNQKKDSHVMDTMMAFSADIEPNEVSYFADGNFRKSRDVFGPLSSVETSPVSVKLPSPKKRRIRKPALGDLSVNAPRLRAPRCRKAVAARSPSKKVVPAPPALMTDRLNGSSFLKLAPTLNPLSTGGFGNAFKPTPEEEAEFKLTLGNMKTKSPFSIFQDCAPAESPVRTESSLEDHRYEDFLRTLLSKDSQTRFEFSLRQDLQVSHDGLPGGYPPNPASSTLVSPTPAPKMASSGIEISGKENGKVELPNRHHIHRPVPLASHVFPSQVFYDASFNPLYNHAFAQTFGYGEPQLSFKDHIKSPGFSSFNGDFRPTSTISQTTQCHSKTTSRSTDDGLIASPLPDHDNDLHFDM